MKKFSTLSMASIALATLPFLTSCQDEDFGYTEQQIKTSRFAKNFEAEYGKINPEQSWDLSSSMPRTSKYNPFSFGNSQTRSAINGYTETQASEIATYPGNAATGDYAGWYDVQSETLIWFNNELKEHENNTNKGKPFSLITPDKGFSIIPIFQGEAGMDWQLHVVDKTAGKDYMVWTESQGMVRSDDGSNWSTIPTECKYNESGLIKNESSSTFGFNYIKSQPIQLNIEKDHEIFLYLKVIKGQWKDDGYGDGNYAKTGAEQRSDEGMMLALECPIPSNVGSTDGTGNLAMIIGCEDADGKDSDWDMNDVCFLIVGHPNIPDRISYTSKRYMCEDLGNTYDFDFNDIVVDVTEATYYSAVSTPIVKDGKNYVNFQKNEAKTKQYATVTHVCGTLPFQVTVGNYRFPVVEDPTNKESTLSQLSAAGETITRGVNWNPNVTKQITGWDPAINNITINVAKEANNTNIDVLKQAFTYSGSNGTVEENKEEEHIYRINFPGRGKAPLIIAVDPTIGWMDEHVHIPETWWKNGSVFDENAGSGNDSQHSSEKLSLEVTSLPWDDIRELTYGNNIVNNMILKPSCFSSIQAGDIISFTTTGDLSLYIANPDRWESVTNGKNYVAGSNNEPGVVTLKVTESLLESFRQYGLGLNGNNVIVTHIESYTPVQYTLTITAGDHGWISVDDGEFVKSFNQSVDAGTHTIKAKGESGYALDKWSDNVTTKTRIIDIQGNLELSASFKESSDIDLWSGRQQLNYSEGLYIDKKNFEDLTTDYKIVVTVESGPNLQFYHNWTDLHINNTNGKELNPVVEGDNIISISSEDVNGLKNEGLRITGDGTVITQVRLVLPPQFTISVASANVEQGTVEIVGKSESSFTGSGNVQIKANPETGYKFVSWTKPDGSTSTENPLSVTLSEATAGIFTATFAEITKVTITASSNNLTWGTVNTAGGEYYEGNSVTLTAEATNNGVFVNWTKDGNSASTEATLNLIASESTAGVYQAIFREKLSYSVTLTAGKNGTAEITTSPNAADNKYYEGTSVTLSATPEDGFKVARWTKNGNTISGENRNTLTIVVSNEDTYGVEFEDKPAGPTILYTGNTPPNNSELIKFNTTNLSEGNILTIRYNNYLNVRLTEWGETILSGSSQGKDSEESLTLSSSLVTKIQELGGLYIQGGIIYEISVQ